MGGLRIPGIFRLYAIEPNGTYINSLLANVWLLLVCSMPCVQFCTIAFPEFARNTSVDMMFGSQIQYMRFFSFFFTNNIFIYILMAFCFFTMIWICRHPPNDKNEEL